MMEKTFLLLAADSTHLVMKAENIFVQCGIVCRIIPLPPQLKASCGLSIKAELQDFERIKKIMGENNFSMESYKVRQVGFQKNFEKI
ncbi:MAG: DUF3343 domain-containing protein [Fusobacteriaceae bacterium]